MLNKLTRPTQDMSVPEILTRSAVTAAAMIAYRQYVQTTGEKPGTALSLGFGTIILVGTYAANYFLNSREEDASPPTFNYMGDFR